MNRTQNAVYARKPHPEKTSHLRGKTRLTQAENPDKMQKTEKKQINRPDQQNKTNNPWGGV
jgi:hypothetical protein